MLALGSSGGCVTTLQQDLNHVNGANLNVDGRYGALTRQAVINVQRTYGLERDGTVGEKTAQTLSNLTRYSLAFPQSAPANYPPSFDPAKAGAWAKVNAQSYVSQFKPDPCTDFVSRALAVAGMAQDDAWWDPDDSVQRYMHYPNLSGPWINVTKAAEYWVGQGWAREIPLDLRNPASAVMARPGDLIYFQWDGSTHMAMVTGMSGTTALKSEQNGGATPPFSTDGQWHLSYSRGQVPVIDVSAYKGVQAKLLHWNEQPQ
ncbi:peptidoglycan-binding protein [Streptomyces coeruleorubidus]|uniref:peptidoglycan-binding protein n=1 Tax=Streptomyces coeruleorubidus TaxID=116188 RepID=UPI0036F9B451